MKCRCRRSGFTLVELLVVIAIICILASILLPVFERAREKSRTAVCQSQQKELLAALMLYTEDYDGMLPWWQFFTFHDFGGSYGVHIVRLYYDYVKDDRVILCPSMQAYCYNETLTSPVGHWYYSTSSKVKVHSPDVWWKGRPLTSVKMPSITPAFFDAFRYHAAPGDLGPNGWGWGADDATNSARMTLRHNGGANYAFLDGHSQWYPPVGGGIYMPIDGLDYDGDGIVGDSTTMR
jgi:prepilin-type N-terminal cleavage/methylation domain-containing protein/prepilin-type processing-associated H-X9-DG protein